MVGNLSYDVESSSADISCDTGVDCNRRRKGRVADAGVAVEEWYRGRLPFAVLIATTFCGVRHLSRSVFLGERVCSDVCSMNVTNL